MGMFKVKAVLTGAFLLFAVASAAQAQDAGPTELTPAPKTSARTSDRAVMDDIERTLNQLSGQLRIGSRRIRVNPGASAGDVDIPTYLDLPLGKARSVDLPANAREVVIGNPAVTDVTLSSRRRLFVMGRAAGQSNVFVLGGDGSIIARVEISVGVDADAVRQAIRTAMPDENIRVEAQGAALVLSGSVSSDGAAGRMYAIARRFVTADEQVVNLVKVQREQQVLIKVKVAEVQRTIVKQLGFDVSIGSGARVFSALNITGALSGTTAYASSITSPGATFSLAGIRDIGLALDLLENRGLVRNLAEPNLVAVSGETAAMLAGGELPIPVSDDDGITIEYKPFGVTLSFLPVIMDGGRINMKLTTEVSSISSRTVTVNVVGGSATYNGFNVRRASSTVELPNGGSLMIAGLIQNDIVSSLDGVPGVMDLPILGALFRSEQFRRDETELVILVTATLVRPTGSASLVAPTDAISPGGDLDFWLFGRILGRYAPGFIQDTAIRADRKMLPYGFVLDEVVP